MSKILYVTDAGSIKHKGVLFIPGSEIPLSSFNGFEESLKELLLDGKLSQRKRRMRTDDSGRVIKMDRSSEAPPLPSELSEYDAKSKRVLRPIESKIVNGAEISEALAALKHEQAVATPGASEKTEATATQEPKQPEAATEEQIEKLSEIADAAASEEDEIFDEPADELFDEDTELLQELNQEKS